MIAYSLIEPPIILVNSISYTLLNFFSNSLSPWLRSLFFISLFCWNILDIILTPLSNAHL